MIDGQTYLWKFSPGYRAGKEAADAWQCDDVFAVYLFQAKNSPLQIHFLTWEDPVIGGPLRVGLPLDLQELHSGPAGLNLHTPGDAARVILLALQAGWVPEQGNRPFVIKDGVQWLKERV
ncbi:MAG TPA: hypothetical protein VF458_02280 [Ktedonobacteraceae bacterium]